MGSEGSTGASAISSAGSAGASVGWAGASVGAVVAAPPQAANKMATSKIADRMGSDLNFISSNPPINKKFSISQQKYHTTFNEWDKLC
jgi:hypothetical protein